MSLIRLQDLQNREITPDRGPVPLSVFRKIALVRCGIHSAQTGAKPGPQHSSGQAHSQGSFEIDRNPARLVESIPHL